MVLRLFIIDLLWIYWLNGLLQFWCNRQRRLVFLEDFIALRTHQYISFFLVKIAHYDFDVCSLNPQNVPPKNCLYLVFLAQ